MTTKSLLERRKIAHPSPQSDPQQGAVSIEGSTKSITRPSISIDLLTLSDEEVNALSKVTQAGDEQMRKADSPDNVEYKHSKIGQIKKVSLNFNVKSKFAEPLLIDFNCPSSIVELGNQPIQQAKPTLPYSSTSEPHRKEGEELVDMNKSMEERRNQERAPICYYHPGIYNARYKVIQKLLVCISTVRCSH